MFWEQKKIPVVVHVVVIPYPLAFFIIAGGANAVRENTRHFSILITEQTLLKTIRHFYGPLRALEARASTGAA